MKISILTRVCILLSFFAVTAKIYAAQENSATLRGQATDPSGAIVQQANVSVTLAGSTTPVTTTTNKQGTYEFKGLAPGTYTLTATAAGFGVAVQENIELHAGETKNLDFSLPLEEQKQQVEVSAEAVKVEVAPAANASSVVVSQKEMDAIADDPDELQNELSALAGPSVGPNGGQFYVDGFTIEDQIPPKNAIREIRVNQNPFSAAYDKLGYGRVEIFTKPGSDKFHGQFTGDGNDLAFDTRDPFSANEPGYYSMLETADVTGPISKKASFFFDFQHRNIANNDVVNGFVLDPNLNQTPFGQTLSNPSARTVIGPRFDYQLSKNNIFAGSYQYWQEGQTNLGAGALNLASQAYNSIYHQHIVRLNDTQIISESIVNEMKFQFIHQHTSLTPASLQPEISVLGAFIGGGNTIGALDYEHHHWEFDDDASIALKKHFVRFGGRYRASGEPYYTPTNFNGTYTFASLSSYQITERGLALGWTPAQIAAAGGGPTQFSILTGTPVVDIFSEDLGVYAEDDWRLRPNLTLSYGLRFETQNYINDHADWAPRLGIAWGVGRGSGRTPKTVLRVGAGIFYDRFGAGLELQAEELNGVNQTEYLIKNPTFYPNIPSISTLASVPGAETLYRVDPKLRAPYTIQSAASVERQVSKALTISVTYLNSRGDHQFITNNINSPLPGTYNPSIPLSGVRPFPNEGNIYQYESDAIFKQNQVITNFNLKAGRRASFFGFYALGYADSDTAGAASFPENPYNIPEDWGRAAFDIRDHVVVGGSFAAPYGLTFSPLVTFQSGTPYNLTIGQDLLGTSILNQRPAFATASTPAQDVLATSYGTFNIAPTAGEPLIPINDGVGPRLFATNLRVSKTISFGHKTGEHAAGGAGEAARGPQVYRAGNGGGPGGGDLGSRGLSGTSGSGGSGGSANRRYSLTFSLSGRNIFNDVNFAPPIGNLGSPLFGRSDALAGGTFSFQGTNRRVDAQVVFNF